MNFPTYPKILALGHRYITDLMDGNVVVQEKIDGSQLNWTWDADGELHVKSKGMWQYGGDFARTEPETMFKPAIQHLAAIDGMDYAGVFFRGETLTKVKHGALTYGRVPKGNVVLFDATDEGWNFEGGLKEWADMFGIDYVPDLYRGPGDGVDFSEDKLSGESILGGPIEGIVIKNYGKFSVDSKPLMGKLVRQEYIELAKRSWKTENPGKNDQIQLLILALNTPARFAKAVQHLEERGELVNAEQDIGKLMVEVKRDVLEEEKDWIIDKLVKSFMPVITRGIGRGLPEWYKERLRESYPQRQDGNNVLTEQSVEGEDSGSIDTPILSDAVA